MDDIEKQIVELRHSFFNLFNAYFEIKEIMKQELEEVKTKQKQFDERLSRIENLLNKQNGNSGEK